MFRAAIPVLHVSSSTAAEEFYCGKLGFSREFAYRPGDDFDPGYIGLVRDEARIHVSSFRDDSVPGASVYLYVDDVDGLHAELLGKGVVIDLPPTDQTWGNREMYLRDADRNRIAFVQESRR
jgi:catechol 2,3-dioxygenase-like lactoylglutathione lyase family enzyme